MTVNLFLYRISLARVNRVIIAAAASAASAADADADDDDDDDDDQGGHTSCWP